MLAGASGALARERPEPVGVRPYRLLEPHEPWQAVVQPFGGDAVEAGEEDAQPLVHRVDHAKLAVLLQARAGGGMLGDAEGGKHALVALMGVGRHPGARTETLDGVSQGLILRPSPVGHAAELVSGIIGSADDADLEAGDAARMDGAAVLVGLPRHLGSAPCPVSREGLVEVGAVYLPGDRRSGPEGEKRALHDLAESHAHEPGGPEAHMARLRALPQA